MEGVLCLYSFPLHASILHWRTRRACLRVFPKRRAMQTNMCGASVVFVASLQNASHQIKSAQAVNMTCIDYSIQHRSPSVHGTLFTCKQIYKLVLSPLCPMPVVGRIRQYQLRSPPRLPVPDTGCRGEWFIYLKISLRDTWPFTAWMRHGEIATSVCGQCGTETCVW